MKISQWFGFNEESSQYLLRRGELRALVNLQPRRPGMLISRQGSLKLYGKYDDEMVAGLFRRDTLVGDPSDFLCFQKAVVDKTLTAAEIAAGKFPQELVWIVRRIQGYQERVIAQLPISPTGASNIPNFCVAEDRHGRSFIFFGHGAKPLMYRPTSISNVAIDLGMEAPKVAPVVVPDGEGYFLETVDVMAGGGSYWGPPTITVEGGNPSRQAKVKGIVRAGNLTGVDVIDGGAGYKSFPQIVVGSDKVGAGFRAVGNLEADPGIQGFGDTTPGNVDGSAPGADETVGETNSVLNNRIMYQEYGVVASTKTVALSDPFAITNVVYNVVEATTPDPNAPTRAGTPSQRTPYMAVESLTGIQIGDVITISSDVQPWPFSQSDVVRVVGIDDTVREEDGAKYRVLGLSKPWSPTPDVSYTLQFRRESDIGYADAEWDSVQKRFRALVPLRTTRGTGSGAKATLEFSPVAYSYGLGTLSVPGYTTPSGGVEAAQFAWKENAWEPYINDDYWKGSFSDKENSAENKNYAGLQASGKSFVFGYSGDVSSTGKGKSRSRRADVYWPDYSSISVWLCTGALSDNLNQWTRVDAKVYDGNTSNPYAIIDLKPTAATRVSSQTGKMSYATASKNFAASPSFRYPTIKIRLRPCPDSWKTSVTTNGNFNYNLPFSVKEKQTSRLAWWNAAATTPRPIVDISRNDNGEVTWDTIEVLDAGAGWERDATFGLRIHQANPYDYKEDYNTAVREPSMKAGHSPFAKDSRFAQFVFKATEPDNLTPAGPPNTLAGLQYVDVSGTGYKSGDTAEVTLLKRKVTSTSGTESLTFYGVITTGGKSTEYVFSQGVQGAGCNIINVSGLESSQKINIGDQITCTESLVLLPGSRVLRKDGLNVILDKMKDPSLEVNVAWSATGITIQDTNYLDLGEFSSPLLVVGRLLRNSATGGVVVIEEIRVNDGRAYARVAGAFELGASSYLPYLQFTVSSGVSRSQTLTWAAEQISAGTGEQRVTSIRIVSGGRNYFTPPTVVVRGGGSGYGLSVTPNVEGGKITSCQINDPGRAYTSQPELYTDSSAGTAVPVMRPTMRGMYRCAYRFADRSETIVATTSIERFRGDSPTTITLASVDGVEPGMVLESERLPLGAKVVSVTGNQVELNQPVSGVGYMALVVVESPGSGYTANEPISATASSALSSLISVTRSANETGSYSVSGATVTTAGPSLLPVGKIRVVFSPPANGGFAASGYAIITRFNPAATYSKSVTVRDLNRPIAYSNFSPIVDVDAGPTDGRDHSSEMKWTLAGVTPPARADMVELWRTSGDQSLVFYRLEQYGIPSLDGVELVGSDTLSDEELYDSDRPNYAALPVVLPNGNINAYRFGQPRTDMSVCVAFQDRLWYGVSTSGKYANTLYYSEFDEFESNPDVNELPIQNNQRATDSLTALVPFGSLLLAMQHQHTYALTYNTEPSVDASIQMISHRGCLHQRCWDIYENVLYAADESGIYTLTRSAQVEAISAPIRDWFNSELIDFSKRESFFLTVCPRTQILRFFCCMTSQTEDTPTLALCYDTVRKTWWTERYPNSLCSAVTGRPGLTRINNSIYGAADGNLYEFTGDKDHTNQTITRCEVRGRGKGYKRAPKITCPSSKGVQLKGVISEGRLVDVLVLSGGWDCKWGMQLRTESKTVLADGTIVGEVDLADGKGILLQGPEYAPIVLDIEPPPSGGTEPEAVAHFSVTTRLFRDVTVAQGESFVRIRIAVNDPIDSYIPPLLITQDGRKITAVGGAIDGLPIQVQPLPVEIGMEAISDFLPLNAFVSKVVGADIYLEHPDGTPVVVLGGAARTDTNPVDGYKESGGSQAIVYFRKPYYTHIPFRLATGALQLANEENISKGGDGMIDRSVSLVYSPTESTKEVEIIQYYNDSSTPRPNVMRRSRGGPGGFEHRQDSASTVLDMSRSASALADATGVAKAMFAGRVYTDATGEDQHIQVELHSRPLSANGGSDLAPQKFVMHSMTINGVIDAE
jgi:hypothetical protein